MVSGLTHHLGCLSKGLLRDSTPRLKQRLQGSTKLLVSWGQTELPNPFQQREDTIIHLPRPLRVWKAGPKVAAKVPQAQALGVGPCKGTADRTELSLRPRAALGGTKPLPLGALPPTPRPPLTFLPQGAIGSVGLYSISRENVKQPGPSTLQEKIIAPSLHLIICPCWGIFQAPG